MKNEVIKTFKLFNQSGLQIGVETHERTPEGLIEIYHRWIKGLNREKFRINYSIKYFEKIEV